MADAPYAILDGFAAYTAPYENSSVRGEPIGYYLVEDDAKIAAEKQGWWGGPGLVEPCRLIRLANGDTFALAYPGPINPGSALKAQDRGRELERRRRLEGERIAQQVWDQLTPAERAALSQNITHLTKVSK